MKNPYVFSIVLVSATVFLGGCNSQSTNTDTKITPSITPVITISEEEKAFNESGQAKAIEDETDMWKVYEDKEAGISFSYPLDVKLIDSTVNIPDPKEKYIGIRTREIGKVENPMDFSKEDDLKNIEALAQGEYGLNFDFALEPSKKVASVGFLFAQDYVVLSRIEVCNVTLERSLLFYHNNKQIIITSVAPIDTLKSTMPEYFALNKENCGEEKVWDLAKQEAFYQTLENQKGSPEIQSWYNQFGQIIEKIMITNK